MQLCDIHDYKTRLQYGFELIKKKASRGFPGDVNKMKLTSTLTCFWLAHDYSCPDLTPIRLDIWKSYLKKMSVLFKDNQVTEESEDPALFSAFNSSEVFFHFYDFENLYTSTFKSLRKDQFPGLTQPLIEAAVRVLKYIDELNNSKLASVEANELGKHLSTLSFLAALLIIANVVPPPSPLSSFPAAPFRPPREGESCCCNRH